MEDVFNNSKPIFMQIAEKIGSNIVMGDYPPGAKIPSVREFSLMFEVNPNTVQKALQDLEDFKLIYTDRTNGKFVTSENECVLRYKSKLFSEKTEAYIKEIKLLGMSNEEIGTKFKNELNKKEN